MKLSNDLRDAIKRKDFIVYYQPRVDVKDNRIAGMEALVRWWVPGRGMVSPFEFIPLAEEYGLIKDIDYIVLEEACRQTKRWNDHGYPVSVSVNLSAKQFEDDRLLHVLDDVLQTTGIKVQHLELEITESAVMENLEDAIEMIKTIKNKGIKVLLDDFGTGYSSLNYLKKIPMDILKIDKSFMDKVTDDSKKKS